MIFFNHTYRMLIALLFFFILLSSHPDKTLASDEKNTIKIGVIVDENSSMGKEQETAMQIAVESFNNGGGSSMNNNSFSLRIIKLEESFNINGGLLQIAQSAQKLVEENQVQVMIVGLDNWQATSLIAQIGSQAQVPTFSLVASPPISPPYPFSLQWPYLIQMAQNGFRQTKHFMVSIAQAYLWRRVTVVSEADANGGDPSTMSLLTEALQKVGTQIEHHLVLPPFSLVENPNSVVHEAFSKFLEEGCYSRVFIVLKVSLPYVSHLFNEAKEMGLMSKDSAWIITEEVMDLLPCLGTSTMLSMEGALGFMTKFDNSSLLFQEFQARFWLKFPQDHRHDNSHEPSFHALLAYDAITIINKALTNLHDKSATKWKQEQLLIELLQSNFTGLSGRISFDQDNNAVMDHPETKLVNMVGESYSEILDFSIEDIGDDTAANKLATKVISWPGSLKLKGGVPKGWVMPTEEKPMKIGVPVVHSYYNFIDFLEPNQSKCHCEPKTKANISNQNKKFTGFCPELFREVLKVLDYNLHYEFIPYCGPYGELVHHVYNKKFDAVVGDVTILANRTEWVDFTFPFEDSGLSIVLPVVEPYDSHGTWVFLRPFTLGLWLLTLGLLSWNMLIIWVLEYHKENEQFRGPWRNQLSTIVWFTFSTLFFAQRERISSNLARVVVVIWLFIVLILTQSYTANLSSMLTIGRLNQTTIDIEALQRSNVKVGYDKASFVNKFLEDLFQFNSSNIVGIEGGFDQFHEELQTGKIKAALLEILYAHLFANQYCNQYTVTTPRYRYGGLAFVFPKGSPVAIDVSRAILKLTENGGLKKLEKRWLNESSSHCYSSSDDFTADDFNGGSDDDQSSSLRLHSFWVLFAFSIATSTLCFLAFILSPCKNRWTRVAPAHNSVRAAM